MSNENARRSLWEVTVGDGFNPAAEAIILSGDSTETLKTIPDGAVKLVITSPPYNIGKAYEQATHLDEYLRNLTPVVNQVVRVLADSGSLCWQVGNYVEKGEVYPLDVFYYPYFKQLGLKLRNRLVWYFDHGLHASKRFSGRYEVLLWFTKTDSYTFNLDSVRVPAKYPGKTNYKPGENYGKPTGEPVGQEPMR